MCLSFDENIKGQNYTFSHFKKFEVRNEKSYQGYKKRNPIGVLNKTNCDLRMLRS